MANRLTGIGITLNQGKPKTQYTIEVESCIKNNSKTILSIKTMRISDTRK